MLTSIILIVLIFMLISSICIGKYNENYWKKRGVKFDGKNKVMGVFWDFITGERSLFLLLNDIYKQYQNEPAVAFGSFLTPALYVKDYINIRHVMRADFHSFSHRGLAFHENDKLALNVLLLHGPRWKLIRQNMTPLFTTSKLKHMFSIIDRSAQDFVNFLKTDSKILHFDTHETINTYSCAAIAASMFGIGTKPTFQSKFLRIVKKALRPTFLKNVRFSISTLCAPFFKAMGMTLFSVKDNFFVEATKQVIKRREKEDVKNHDFADICVRLQKNGKMTDRDKGFELEPTDELLAAQAYIFFLAGVEPCAAVMFNALLEIGRNPVILQRVHTEIDETFEKCNGVLTYDAVAEMVYINKVINESLRMYPPIGFITRECVQDTELPVGNIKVDKGTKIFTPIYEVHRDPKFFPEPDVFDPERFSPDGVNKVNYDVFMPFGKGNRICIGIRYAMMLMRLGMVHMLRHYSVKTIVQGDEIKYKKEQVQVRIKNVAIELVPRHQ